MSWSERLPAPTVVANTAPTAMKAPARIESAKSERVSRPAFFTPTSPALRAISAGMSASIRTSDSWAGMGSPG